LRADLRAHPEYCERMPTLRNVASRRKLLSHRRFHALKDARLLHTERDNLGNGITQRDGAAPTFDDLPVRCHRQHQFRAAVWPASRRSPAPSSQEVNDIIAFLQTLKDGHLDEKRRW
jgi:cytochrome c peroxidase